MPDALPSPIRPATRDRTVPKLIAMIAIVLAGSAGILAWVKRNEDSSHKQVSPNAATLVSGIVPAAQSPRTNETEDMVKLLNDLVENTDPMELNFGKDAERADRMKQAMESATEEGRRQGTRLAYGFHLLSSGQVEKSLEIFLGIKKDWQAMYPVLWEQQRDLVDYYIGGAYLRKAELENCCAVANSDSCLLPITGGGIHARRQGSSKAMEIFKGLLQRNPENLTARWLLTIAAMTLDDYPAGVPAQWRIKPSAFKSDYDIKRFTNVADSIGLKLLGHAGGAVVDDLDGDGYLDVMVSGLGLRDQLRFFHNNGNVTFTERTKEAKLTGQIGGLNLLSTDFNNDGRLDVLVLRGGWMGKAGRFPCSLLQNQGDGTFQDVTQRAGLMRAGPTQTAVWFDYNNDGNLDLYMGFESDQNVNQPCALYRNNGDGTFADVAKQAGVDHTAFVKGVISGDYDNDGWADLYVSQMSENRLYHNNGNGTFSEVAEQAGVQLPKNSFSCFFFDYDNDGWQDLFVGDYNTTDVESVLKDLQGLPTSDNTSRLYRNNKNGTFTDVSQAMRLNRVMLVMGLNFGDLDNDGFLDIYAGTGNPDLTTLIPNRMFRNDGGKKFQEVTTSGNFGHLQKGHGIAFADINNDGCQDVFEEMGGAFDTDTAYSALYANPGHGNRWITLRLEGVKANRAAIGARIKVSVQTPTGRRSFHRSVGTGGSFGCSPLRQEIGLGKATAIESVEVYWPVSGTTQVVRGLDMNRFYVIKEGRPEAVPYQLKSTSWTAAVKSARTLSASVRAMTSSTKTGSPKASE